MLRIEEDEQGVTVYFEDGSEARGACGTNVLLYGEATFPGSRQFEYGEWRRCFVRVRAPWMRCT